MNYKGIFKNYLSLGIMIFAIVAGSITGWLWPGATVLKPLGTVFINIMFCLVVPLVFASISGAVSGMKSYKRAGKILGISIISFVATVLVAAMIMCVLVKVFPPVSGPWGDLSAQQPMEENISIPDLIVNFLTAPDFVALLSKRAMLPLIIISILFGFAVNLNGGSKSPVGVFLTDLSAVMVKLVRIVTYYAPIAFFGFFADLVATYGPQITESYGKAVALFYPTCIVYSFVMFPLLAFIGGGKTGVKVMMRGIFKPMVTALGTCSSVASIPANVEASRKAGIPKDISDIVLPLGATMHMDGSSLSCVLKVAFMFGVFGMDFGGADTIIKVLLVSVLSSVGMSGVPGGGYIGEYIICSVFFPDKMDLAFPIIVTIGNVADPIVTMVNSTGNYAVSFVVARFVDGKKKLLESLNINNYREEFENEKHKDSVIK